MTFDPTRISDPATRAMARELAEMRRKLDTLESGLRSTQLGNSSVDNGTLWFTDGGVKRVGIGAQVDGKFGWFAVNGDPPPRPTPPTLTPGPNGITIGWDGQFVGPAPSDFVHVKAYLSPVGASFIRSDGNCVGHLLGNARLPVNPLPQTGHWCVLIAFNTSGVASDPSIVQGPVTPGAVVATEILDGIVTETKLAAEAVTQAKLAAGAVGTAQLGSQVVDLSKLANGSVDATKIVDGSITPAKVTFTAADIGSIATYYQASAPTGTIAQGSLWADSDDQNKLYRYSGSGWVAVNDQGVAAALASAQQAQTDAANALSAAAGAEAAVDGKVTVYYQPASPSGANTGDLWLDIDDANKLYRWSGSTWTLVSDTRIATALVNAQTAQSTADGKIDAFYQGTAPTAGMSVGDLWYNTSSGNLASRWNGAAWVPLPTGSGALADEAVTSTKIAGNAVVAGKIAANAVGTNELVANSVVAGKLAADSVTSTNIVAGGVQTANLAAGSVSTEKLIAGSVIAEKIAALAVTADKLAANSVTAGAIEAGAITADKLSALLVLASTLIAGDPDGWHTEIGDAQTPLLYWDNTNTGFALSRDPVTGQSNAYLSGRIEFGNGSQIENDYLDLCEQASTGFKMPKRRQGINHSPQAASVSTSFRWGTATMRGSMLLMGVFAETANSPTTTPAFTIPSGWTLIKSESSGNSRLAMYYVPAATASRSTETVTADRLCNWNICIFEYQGLTSSPLDVSASAAGTGSTFSTGTTAATTQGNELQFALWGSPDVSSFTGPSVTNQFKFNNQSTSYGRGYATAFRSVTGIGSAEASITANKSTPWMGMVASFRAALAAPVPVEPPTSVLRLFTRRSGGKSNSYVLDDAGQAYPVGRSPFCWARLGADATLTAGVNVWAQQGWVSVKDDYGLLSLSTSAGTYTSITIPLDGYYWIEQHSQFGLSSSTASIGGFVAKNTRAKSALVASDLRGFRNFGDTTDDGSPVQTTRLVPLAAGDVLYWGNWSNVGVTLYAYRWNIPTEIKVAYQGPLN